MMIKRRNGLLAFMLAIATGCTALACVLFGGSVTARADSLQKNTTEILDLGTDGSVTLTPASRINAYTGALIQSDKRMWVYGINGTMFGDSRIEYTFTTQQEEATAFTYYGSDGERVFTAFVAPSSTDRATAGCYGGLYLESEYQNPVAGTYAFVSTYWAEQYGAEIPVSLYQIHTVTASGAKKTAQFIKNTDAPSFVAGAADADGGNRGALETAADRVGFLPALNGKFAISLSFGADALSVRMDNASGVSTELVSLPYASYPEVASMRDGYTLKIGTGADENRGYALVRNEQGNVPSLISINGLALTEEQVTVSETFADIVYDGGETFDGTNAVIALREGDSLGTFSYSSFLGIMTAEYGELRFPEVYQSGRVDYPQGEKYSAKGCGEYTLRVPYGSIEKSYKLVIGREFSDILDLGTDGSVTLTPASRINAYTGALIQSDKRMWVYGINGTMFGDSRIEYTFTTQQEEATAFTYYGSDGERVFTAFVAPSSTDRATAGCYGGLYLESEYQNPVAGTYAFVSTYWAEQYGAEIPVSLYQIHTVTASGAKKTAQFIKNTNDPSFVAGTGDSGNIRALETAADRVGFLPALNGKFAISLSFGADALSVRMDNASGVSTELVSLPYASYPEVASMRDGYTLKIGTGADENRGYALVRNEQGNVPSLISINGAALDGVYPEITYANYEIHYKNEKVEGTTYVIELDETEDLSAFYVTADYTFGGILLDQIVNRMMYADETFGDRETNEPYTEYVYTFVYGGESVNAISKEYVIRIYPSVPELTLQRGVNGYETIFKDQGERLQASPSDVLAEDKVDGRLSDISISVKAPNGSGFVAYDSFVWNADEYGVYTVRYTAVNLDGRTGTIDRFIRYMPSRPRIELSEELPTVGYTGKKIVLPVANMAATVSVLFDGEAIAIVDGGFTPHESGTYEITYVYTDDYEITAVLQASIVVLTDVTPPVITAETAAGDLKVGDKLVAPAASATDEADGALQVTTAIYFEGRQVGESEVETEKAGIYTIVYTATDSLGNTARKDVQVFVYSPSTDAFSDDAGSGVTAWIIVVATVVPVSIALGVTVILLMRKKNIKRKTKNEK